MNYRAIAIIPARGGSQRIPNKNIRAFCGRPIIAYSVQAALSAGCFAEVMVSTDSPEIAQVARAYGASVPFLRSEENSSDVATTVAVWREVIVRYQENGCEFPVACSVLPTAPFVTAARLRESLSLLDTHPGWDAVMCVVAYSAPIQRAQRLVEGELKMFWPEHARTRSQDLETAYHDAGQCYAFRPPFILSNDSLRDGRLGALIVSEMEAQDIDTEEDWRFAEMKYEFGQRNH